HHQSNPSLPAGTRHRGATGTALPAVELPRILATPPDVLSPRMVRVIEGLASDWHRVDERIEVLSSEIEELAKRDAGCERLMSIPGIGPIISSAMVSAIEAGDSFSKGRDFAAWLGLVPRQISTGDRTILGKISKRGNRYLRVLFVQAAWVVLVKVKPTRWQGHGLRPWIEAAKKRLHHNVPTSSRASRGAFLLMIEPSRQTSFKLLRNRSRVIELPAPPRSARG